MNRGDCKHPSAFCLMQFRSADRAYEETVWNSRDQAVPAKIPRGKSELLHADPHRDEFKPFNIPRVGTRMFIDPVLDKAEKMAAGIYAERQAEPEFIKDYGDDRRKALAKLTPECVAKVEEGGAVRSGAVLVTVTEEMAARIEARLGKRGGR